MQRTNILMLMSISVLTKALVLLRMWWSLFNSNGNSSPVQNLHVCRHSIVLVISKLDWTVVQMQTKEQQRKQEHKQALLVQHDAERRCMKWMLKILLLVVAKDKDSRCNNGNELCAEDYKSQKIKSKI